MSSLTKMLAILDLFGSDRPNLTIDDIMGQFGLSRPTAYRYVRDLCRAGLLSRFRGEYTLGPRPIQLDYLIRQNDPLLSAGAPVMAEVRDRHGCDVTLLTMYEDKILCIHHEVGMDAATITFGRGQVQPLFLGAGAKAILASLPRMRQKKLFVGREAEAARSQLAGDLETYLAKLAEIRRAGVAVSEGELDAQSVGIAAAVTGGPDVQPAALVMVVSRQRYGLMDKQAAMGVARAAADRIRAAMSHPPVDAPASSERRLATSRKRAATRRPRAS